MRGAARFISWRTRSRETGAESGSAGLVGTPPDADSLLAKTKIAERGKRLGPRSRGAMPPEAVTALLARLPSWRSRPARERCVDANS
jgi:hypothetical protein